MTPTWTLNSWMDPKMVLEGDEVALDGAEVDHLVQEDQGEWKFENS